MKSVELNPAGNFVPWQAHLLEELKTASIGNDVGQLLLFENDGIKVWSVVLMPGERLPFREIKANLNCVCRTDGMAITRCADGKIVLHHVESRDTLFLPFEENKAIFDLENIGDDVLILLLTEFKPTLQGYRENMKVFTK